MLSPVTLSRSLGAERDWAVAHCLPIIFYVAFTSPASSLSRRPMRQVPLFNDPPHSFRPKTLTCRADAC